MKILKKSHRQSGVKKIAVVTGTRAEYGILKPLLKKIKASAKLDLKLIVTGMHLLKKYGSAINDIKKDGFKIDSEIPMYAIVQDGSYYGQALARGINGLTLALSKMKPDILVVLGDRLESLAAALAAATLRIPIAHIHGGDKTDSGHIDENIRHAITRFANLHFAATDGHRRRLLKMGEEPRRVFRVGALGLDSIINEPAIKKEILFKKLGLDPMQKLIISLFHPVHLEAAQMGREAREIVAALKELKIQTVVLYPNNDLGSQAIIEEIEKVKEFPFIKIFKNIPHEEYVSLLRYAKVLIGNSSSGILEAPAMKLAAVNIGSRNVGREHGENVIFIKARKAEIIKAVKKVFDDKNFQKKIQKSWNPYGDGKTSNRIVKVLEKVKIDKNLLRKKIIY